MPCQQITNTGISYNPPLSSRSGPFASESECLEACQEGACCNGTTCSVKPQCQCNAAAGEVFKGVGTVCSPNPCIGRCCDVSGNCVDGITESQCAARNGYLFAPGTSCNSNPCPIACDCPGDSRIPSSISLQAVPGTAVRTDQAGRPVGSYSGVQVDALWPIFEAAINGLFVSATLSRRLNSLGQPTLPPQFSFLGCSGPNESGWIYNMSVRNFMGCGGGQRIAFGFSRTFAASAAGGGGTSPSGSNLQDIAASGPALFPSDPSAPTLIQCISGDVVMQYNQFPVTIAPWSGGQVESCGTLVGTPISTASPVMANVDLRLTLHYSAPNPLP